MARIKVPVSQLQTGIYIELDLPWQAHPFLFNAFKIKNEKQIRILRGLGLLEVICIPEKSDRPPLTRAEASIRELAPPGDEADIDNEWQEKQERIQNQKKRRERIQKCEKAYRKSMTVVKAVMQDLQSRPVQVIEEAEQLIQSIVDSILTDRETILHLMNERSMGETAYYHALNVSVLSMMLGNQLGLSAEELKNLGMGGLFHDIGKQRVPSQILRKRDALNSAEQGVLNLHPRYGYEISQQLGAMTDAVRRIILQHHEKMDGSGYPDQLQGDAIDRLSRIVAITNTYDNLVNPPHIEDALTPHEALSQLFKLQKNAFDPELLSIFVKHMGVYPPGTLVQLTNGGIGLVIAINPSALLYPSVMLYDPNVPKNEAIIFDLADDREVAIASSIRPAKLAPEIIDYLSPRTRISYFIEPSLHRPKPQ